MFLAEQVRCKKGGGTFLDTLDVDLFLNKPASKIPECHFGFPNTKLVDG